jgi:branched-chain amino acid aminotransferase
MAKVFLNDRIADDNDGAVFVTDAGLLYGMGLFETMRCRSGRVFRQADHLDRLFSSAEKLGISNTYTREYIEQAIVDVLKANDLSDARIRLTLTNGPLHKGDQRNPTLLIAAVEFTPYPAEYYDNGVRVVLTDFRQNPYDPLSGHKTTCYASRLLVLGEAHKKRAAEALWFTTDNRLAEGCISNVFIAKDGAVATPALSAGVLPGIARRTVIEIAESEGVELVEKDLAISDLLAADEVFLTNVIMLVLPVVAVEAHTVGDGKCGEITKKLATRFEDLLKTQ